MTRGTTSSKCATIPRITLPDLLCAIPDLLSAHLLSEWPTPGAGIRVLRLVSKEVGQIAWEAIQSCAVDLRSWDCPTQRKRVVRLLGQACLQKLKINVHADEGGTHSSDLCFSGLGCFGFLSVVFNQLLCLFSPFFFFFFLVVLDCFGIVSDVCRIISDCFDR